MTQNRAKRSYGVVKLTESDDNNIYTEQYNGYQNNLNIELVSYSEDNIMTVYQSGNYQEFDAYAENSKSNQFYSLQESEDNKSVVKLNNSDSNTLISTQQGDSNTVVVALNESDRNTIYTNQTGDENTAYYFSFRY